MLSPLAPAWLVWPLVALAVAALTAATLTGRLRNRWSAMGRRLGVVVLATLVVLNPQSAGAINTDAEALDVFVVIDSSISMTAEDWDGDQARLDGVVADVEELATIHAGARFAMITFDRKATWRMGLTRDNAALVSAAQTIKPPAEANANGTSIDAALDQLVDGLEKASQADPERGRVVYYLGDGEQTAGRKPRSFEAVKELCDGGAVLGYGTKAGARMPISRSSILPNEVDAERRRAVSKIDQAALQQIAEQAGLDYAQRTAPGGLETVAFDGSFTRISDGHIQGTRSVAWLFALGLVGLVAWEMAVAGASLRRVSLLRRLTKEVKN